MTNSEDGRKAFEEVFSKWEDPNDKNKAWKGWRADRESLLAVLESPECVEEMKRAFHEADEAGCTLEQCWKAAISTIVNKLKEK